MPDLNENIKSIPANFGVDRQEHSVTGCPLVSILMLAYNHENFISQAIESILAQQCAFPFELVIGEDCSSDATAQICRSYQNKYPDIICLVISERNCGMHQNFSRLRHRARGKYIAMCEGDDFWCDEHKLARQVDWMQQHPECSMVGAFTEVVEQNADGVWQSAGIIRPAVSKERYTIEDLIAGYSFHFSSILLRRKNIRFPDWFQQVYCVDRPLYLLSAEQGPVGCIPEVTSVYRLHRGGLWSPQDLLTKAEQGIELFDYINAYFQGRYKRIIRKTLGEITWYYMSEALWGDDLISARKLFIMSLRRQCPPGSLRRYSAICKVGIRLYLPRLYRTFRHDV